MASNGLSPDEMDCLLNGLSSDVASSRTPLDHESRPGLRHQSGNGYDQSVPVVPAMSAEQQRAFQSIHEDLADRLSRAWSAKLRGKIDVRVTKVSHSSFGEFAFGLDNPTFFLTLDIPPFAGRSCLEFHPTVLFPMIDRLLGGGKKAGPILRRPLTEIETRLLNRLASIFFEQFRAAWRSCALVAVEIHKIETNPKLSRCISAAEQVEAVEFEINMPFARGPVRIVYPAASVMAAGDQLSGKTDRPLDADQNENAVADVRVLIAERQLSSDAPEYNMQVGDILSTGVLRSEFVQIHIDGQPKFLGRLGQHHGKKAVRLQAATIAND